MGEAKAKSRSRRQILAGNPRCIYCPELATTVEHMPPVWLFESGQRLSGMEYPACKACNEGTRAADLAVGWFARLRPFSGNLEDPLWKEAQDRENSLRQRAPGLIEEVFHRSPSSPRWMQSPRGVYESITEISAEGPLFAAHMITFGAKLAMALYREHVGTPLPPGGVAYVQPFMNGGLRQETMDTALNFMPGFHALRQGRKSSQQQFAYRFNTDEKTIVGAMAGFHSNIHFMMFATSDPNTYDGVLRKSTAARVELGALVETLSKPASLKPVRLIEAQSQRARSSLILPDRYLE